VIRKVGCDSLGININAIDARLLVNKDKIAYFEYQKKKKVVTLSKKT
jgi:hypothetical protein